MKKLLILLISLIPFVGAAQDKMVAVKLKNGTNIKGVIKTIDPTDAVVIEIAGMETKIKMENISDIEEVGLSNNSTVAVKQDPPEKEVEKVAVVVEDPLKNYKGFLLEKGNNVYVYYSNSDEDKNARYDKEAANMLKDLLKKDGFWNVVDNMNQAHFTINYYVDTKRKDKSDLTVSSWRTGHLISLDTHGSNESVEDNKKLAHNFYTKAIKKLQKKILEGKLPKKTIDNFTIK